MAKVIGPLHSFEAHGKLASMVFGVWRGIQWSRMHFIPANPQTAKQVNIRTAMALTVACWQGITGTEKDAWSLAATGKPLSGYNMFCSECLDQYITQLGVTTTPTSVVYTPPYPGSFTWT